eukprot:SAG22_NODE_687_length_7913_cov_2.611851_10_plen_134_part_00
MTGALPMTLLTSWLRLAPCMLAAAVLASGPAAAAAARRRASEVVGGDIRVQALSPTVLRVEPRGPAGGFEDRTTFMVTNRSAFAPPGLGLEISAGARPGELVTSHYTVLLRPAALIQPGTCAGPQRGVAATVF